MRTLLTCAIAFASGLAASTGADARELSVPEDQLLVAEIVELQASPAGDMAAVVLKVDDHTLPIFIGMTEALAIERARRGLQSPRPLTHDLLGDVIVSADLRMRRLVIDELSDDGHYLAVLELHPLSGGPVRRIDSRPSDGMVLAVRSGSTIVVARQIIEQARASKQRPPAQPIHTSRSGSELEKLVPVEQEAVALHQARPASHPSD